MARRARKRFKIRIHRSTGPSVERLHLPAAEMFGHKYFCNHPVAKRRQFLQLEILCNGSTLCYSPWHPTCCQQEWARAIFYLALRRIIKRTGEINLQDLRQLSSQLADFEPFPAPRSLEPFEQIRKEKSFEFAQLAASRTRSARNWNQAVEFVEKVKSRPRTTVPSCFKKLGLVRLPNSVAELNKQYRKLAIESHPDRGGDSRQFKLIRRAYEQAKIHLEKLQVG